MNFKAYFCLPIFDSILHVISYIQMLYSNAIIKNSRLVIQQPKSPNMDKVNTGAKHQYQHASLRNFPKLLSLIFSLVTIRQCIRSAYTGLSLSTN